MRVPLVIVGGGVAGAAAAALLARAGQQVTLLERERTAKPKVCGEFLSCAAHDHLVALGLDPAGLGALPISHLRLAAGGRQITAPLPFTGWSLARDVLDEALLQRATALGADIRRGVVVRSLEGGDRPRLIVDMMGEIEAGAVFLATGKHDLRHAARPVTGADDLIGLKTYFHLIRSEAQALKGHIELVLFDGGYAGLQLVGADRANLSLLVSRQRFAAADNDWFRLLGEICTENALLGTRLEHALPETDRPLAIFRLPFGFRHRPDGQAHLFRLGDQMACMPSFAGDGMSIALHSAARAAQAYLAGAHADAYHARMRRELRTQFLWGRLLSQLTGTHAGRALFMGAATTLPAMMPALARLTRLPRLAQIVQQVD
ncbi:NAD(P)/FAD-dependent oxidoreductase [Dongia rigui]|uniref:FAD-dependent oxidoreductase n=1 Tax=Dongia rigui TaxID=940149 RepID=A0ABU5DTQ9_9PROT|nr:FAD-dependent oxidoreductase [Dongia rigui]MDY0870702.1 FAD-dependent oxidoreductase [Dongia rigui]